MSTAIPEVFEIVKVVERVTVLFTSPSMKTEEKVIEVTLDRPYDELSPEMKEKLRLRWQPLLTGMWEGWTIRYLCKAEAPQPTPA